MLLWQPYLWAAFPASPAQTSWCPSLSTHTKPFSAKVRPWYRAPVLWPSPSPGAQTHSKHFCSSPFASCPIHLVLRCLSMIELRVPGHPGRQYFSNFVFVLQTNKQTKITIHKKKNMSTSGLIMNICVAEPKFCKITLPPSWRGTAGPFLVSSLYSGWVNLILGH